MNEPEPFPNWLKRRRRALDLSRAALAQRAHCSASAIRRLEVGDLRPSPQLAGLLAEALGVPQAERENFVLYARGISQTPPAPDVYSPAFPPAPAAAPPDAIPPENAFGSNLPAPLTSLVGRKVEVTAVCDLLQEPGVRLLTLTGPPGTGKTRLSLAAAMQLAGSTTFPQGACFVPLAPISDANLVLAAVAHALGVAEPQRAGEGDLPLRRAVQAYLRPRRLLLLLDNFEQVPEAAPLVTDLLAAAPGVKALVTSRAVLHLYGEHEFPVPPLPLPDVHNLPTTTAVSYLSRYPALRLFQERARAVRPAFRITAENVAEVARICAWLDGLPLAIEMAAAQMKWLTPAQALAQLHSRLVLLTGGPRDLTPRQQSLSGAIEWSYHLLLPPQRALFDLLGIFVGDFAATAVTGIIERLAPDDGHLDIGQSRPMLQALVEKSLLTYVPSPQGEPRYAMLETLREFAQAKLQEQGRLATARQAHAHYYAALARAAQPFLSQGDEQVAWLDRLERDYLQLRAALTWGVETAVDAGFALEMVENLHHFWYVRGHLSEGRHWLEAALSMTDAPQPLAALVLNRAGQFARLQGDLAQAQDFHEKALAVQQSINDEAGTCRSLENLAILAGSQGDYGRSRDLLQQTLALRRKLSQRDEVISTLNNLAIVQRRLGDLAAAEALYRECAQVCRANGNLRHLSFALHGLGEVAVEQGDAAAGLNHFGESVRLRQQLGDRPELAISLRAMATARLALGDANTAVQLLAASQRLQQELGITTPPRYQAEMEETLAQVQAQFGETAFNRAWAAGSALTLDEAVSLALP